MSRSLGKTSPNRSWETLKARLRYDQACGGATGHLGAWAHREIEGIRGASLQVQGGQLACEVPTLRRQDPNCASAPPTRRLQKGWADSARCPRCRRHCGLGHAHEYQQLTKSLIPSTTSTGRIQIDLCRSRQVTFSGAQERQAERLKHQSFRAETPTTTPSGRS